MQQPFLSMGALTPPAVCAYWELSKICLEATGEMSREKQSESHQCEPAFPKCWQREENMHREESSGPGTVTTELVQKEEGDNKTGFTGWYGIKQESEDCRRNGEKWQGVANTRPSKGSWWLGAKRFWRIFFGLWLYSGGKFTLQVFLALKRIFLLQYIFC